MDQLKPLKINVRLAKDIPNTKKFTRDGIHVYNTTSMHRGVVLIINFYEYSNHNCAPREGSEVDVSNLQQLFEQMGFVVLIAPGQTYTKQDIHNNLKDFVECEQLKKVDISILFVMGHGGRKDGREYFVTDDVKDNEIYFDDIINYFSNTSCLHMQQKPKMIFFQMCRGLYEDKGIQADSHEHNSVASDNIVILPTFTDLLVAYSSVPGYKSWRHPTTGSWFIYALCEEFMKSAHKLDVSTMLEKVYRDLSGKVTEYNGNIIKQSGEFTNKTFAKCFFHPGVYRDQMGVVKNIHTNTQVYRDNMDSSLSLIDAAICGDEGECERLLNEGAKINERDSGGFTPLHWAAYYNYNGIVECLLRNGAAVNGTTDLGNTPAHLAAYNKHTDSYILLVSKEGNKALKNNKGETPEEIITRRIENVMNDESS